MQADIRNLPDSLVLRLANMAIRVITLLSKFFLIFFLARFLHAEELGMYGLIAATISYAIYPLGLDFYTFTTREIKKYDKSEWGTLLKNQSALCVVLYIIFIPLLLSVFIFGLLPWEVCFLFIVLLISEHINQEIYRFLIAISKQLTATTLLFFRSGLWPLILVPLMFYSTLFCTLHSVLILWTICSFFSVFLGGIYVASLNLGGWKSLIDWVWIKKGVKIALPLLISTLFLKGLFTVDRYILKDISGLGAVGAYVFFTGIANTMETFLDAGVFSFGYPAMIVAFQHRDYETYKIELRKMLNYTILFSFIFIILTIPIIDTLIELIGNPIYLQFKTMFIWTLLASFIFSLSCVPHYALYSQNKDLPIIYSHMIGFFIFIPITYLLSLKYNNIAIPLGLCFSFFIILMWKTYAFFCANQSTNFA